jgi:hypothetical protein
MYRNPKSEIPCNTQELYLTPFVVQMEKVSTDLCGNDNRLPDRNRL